MRLAHAVLAVGVALVLVVVLLVVRTPGTGGVTASQGVQLLYADDPGLTPGAPPAPVDPLIPPPPRVFDISLHDAEELSVLLERLETLVDQPRPHNSPPEIALILHGPELNFFAIRNYAEHQALVDLAAKLDAFQIIEVKACLSKMRKLTLAPDDMPAFIELVPFGPEEVRRLESEGYLKM